MELSPLFSEQSTSAQNEGTGAASSAWAVSKAPFHSLQGELKVLKTSHSVRARD